MTGLLVINNAWFGVLTDLWTVGKSFELTNYQLTESRMKVMPLSFGDCSLTTAAFLSTKPIYGQEITHISLYRTCKIFITRMDIWGKLHRNSPYLGQNGCYWTDEFELLMLSFVLVTMSTVPLSGDDKYSCVQDPGRWPSDLYQQDSCHRTGSNKPWIDRRSSSNGDWID